jgi:hypothetical protein
MELEVKHLAPYLAYGLKLVFENFPLHSKDCPHVRILELDCGHDFNLYLQRGHIKPTLHPLSSISKPIEANGKAFIPLHELLKLKYPNWYNENKDNHYGRIDNDNTSAWFALMATYEIKVLFSTQDVFTYPDYWIIEKLAEWHIDFQGLIPAGLAIDINTLKQ